VRKASVSRARQFRDRIASEGRTSGELISTLASPLLDRFRRGQHVPRRDVLANVADAWRRKMQPLSRLAVQIDLDVRRKSLCIYELRLASSEFRDPAWESNELGEVIMLVGPVSRPFHCSFTSHTIAHVGAHALARRFQRGVDGSEAAAAKSDCRASRSRVIRVAFAQCGGAWAWCSRTSNCSRIAPRSPTS
jgi:hypothetical protein